MKFILRDQFFIKTWQVKCVLVDCTDCLIRALRVGLMSIFIDLSGSVLKLLQTKAVRPMERQPRF